MSTLLKLYLQALSHVNLQPYQPREKEVVRGETA